MKSGQRLLPLIYHESTILPLFLERNPLFVHSQVSTFISILLDDLLGYVAGTSYARSLPRLFSAS